MEDFGYPSRPGYPQYAIYQPILDRFLLTSGNLDKIFLVSDLLANRYHTLVVELNSAKNYHPNLIDNSCCENWTCQGVLDLIKPSSFRHPLDISYIASSSIVDYPIQEEKSWAEFLYRWVYRIDDISRKCVHNLDQQIFISSMFDLPGSELVEYIDTINQIKKSSLRILFFANNQEQADQNIKSFFEQCKNTIPWWNDV